ncbi:MAG: DUF3034 family protein [Candidatus Polarisedimenticolia bacterium]
MKRATLFAVVFAAVAALSAGAAHAGAPFVNLEGVGGIAFNPVAYLAGSEPGAQIGPLEIGKPRVGVWYIDLSDSSIDWTPVGVATSFNKRLEVSYGFESIAVEGLANIHKKTLGAKLLVVDENAAGTKWIPAISIGAKHKSTSFPFAENKSGMDYYVVATKLITQAPKPILVSIGAQSTKEQVTGAIGFNNERKVIGFANVDVIPTSWLCLGVEFRQGPDYGPAGGNYKDANYYNVHAGFFVDKNLSFAIAYTNAGENTFNGGKTGSSLGFGGGLVVGVQYAF